MKINWMQAQAEYVSDESVSYGDIAKKYGVNINAVKRRGLKESWLALRAESKLKASQKLPEKIGETIAETNARHIRTGRTLQTVGLIKIVRQGAKPRNADEARKFVETGVNIERRAAGLDKVITNVVVGVRFSSPEFRKDYEHSPD